MKDQEKILKFLDSDLSDKEKSELFASVTDKSLFTDEIQKHEAIKASIARNSSKIKASDNLKNAVLSQTVQKSKTEAFNKIAKYTGAFLLTSIIILLFVLSSNDNEDTKASTIISSSEIETKKNNEVPVVNNFAAENTEIKNIDNANTAKSSVNNSTVNKYSDVQPKKTNNKNLPLEKSNHANNATIADNDEIQEQIEFMRIDVSNNYKSERLNHANNALNYNQLQTNEYVPYSKLFDKSRFSIELFRNNDFHLPQATIDPAENLALNNTMFAISYKIDDNFKLVADYRRENFFQIYSGIDASDGLLKEYRQQPNFQTFGAYLRFEIDITHKFDYFAQAGLSASTPGVIPRIRTGFTYNIYKDFGVIVAGEYSHLFFSHQNQIFDTQKIGIHYGISYSF